MGDEERLEIPSNKLSGHRSVRPVSCYVVGALLLLSVAWNIYLSVNQTRLSDRLSKLDSNQERLLAAVSANSSVWFHSTANSGTVWRVRREADVEPKGDSERRKVKAKKRRRRKVTGAHFVAYFNHDRALREHAEGLSPSVGNMTEDGLVLNGHIYNIWKPMTWNNKKIFQLNAISGKVKVKSTGLYLIYGQIMFHSPYARNSYGIHINDERLPYIEALSYHTSHRYSGERIKRDIGLADPQPYDVISGLVKMNAHENSSHRHSRKKRSSTATYSQCNTMAVAYLNKNDEVFIKSLESYPIVIPTPYLTFWGLVKL